jgi:acetyl-CoA C-acetyltransferase/acetyl-CoA acyltransferase 2
MRSALPADVVFLSARRTAFGTFGGKLKDLTATDLGAEAAKAALAASGVPAGSIGHAVIGNVTQTSPDAIYLARHVALRAGLPVEVPALTVNRLCGSGFEAVVQGAMLLSLGHAEAVLAGGTESMSEAPLVLRGTRFGHGFLKPPPVEDMLGNSLTDSWCNLPMALTAEKLAEQYGITRAQVDEYSALSQRRFAAAQEAGRLQAEIAPLELPGKKGPVVFDRDEHPRPETTVEVLSRLKPIFKKDGLVHAGSASGISDGAGALVLSTRAFAEKRGLRPLARLVSWGTAGVEPSIMGIGPAPAFRQALERAQARLSDVDLFEVNEAFAPQYLAVEKELGLPRDRTNVDGGAIAVGHPLAASGARITAHLIHELRRRGARWGLGGACIGGGQGIAVLLEALP